MYLAAIILVAACFYTPFFLALGMWLSACGAAIAGASGGGTLLFATRVHDTRRAAHVLALGPFVALFLIALDTGGVHAISNPWMILCPVIPAMSVGRRHGIPWAIAAVAAMAVHFGLDVTGMTLPSSIPSELWESVYHFLVPAGLVLAMFAIAWANEVSKEVAYAEVQRTAVALECAHHDAQAAHAAARRLLDSVSDGLLTVSLSGAIQPEYSSAVRALLAPPEPDQPVWEFFEQLGLPLGTWLEMAWQDLESDFMPVEVILGQLPCRTEYDGRTLQVQYVPVKHRGVLDHILLVIADVTADVAAERAREKQDALMAIFQQVQKDRTAVEEFLAEADALVRRVTSAQDSDREDRRHLHTLKGNSGLMGLDGIARSLHELEDRVEMHGGTLNDADRTALASFWEDFRSEVAPLFAGSDATHISIPRDHLDMVMTMAERGASPDKLVCALEQWSWDAIRPRLDRLAERATDLAQRLGKPHIDVQVECDDIRLPYDEMRREFWSSLVHIVRNAVDHGIEGESERVEAGKPSEARIILAAYRSDEQLVVEVRDDGAGIDWDAVAEKAGSAGLPHTTHEELLEALFFDGLSTAASTSETSGRGVGTSAVRHVVLQAGGEVSVDSTRGRGTTFRFSLPVPDACALRKVG